MLLHFRFGAVGVLCLTLIACSGGKNDTATPASTSLPGKALALRSDGTLDPDKIDLSGVASVTRSEQRRAEDLLRTTIVTVQKWSDVRKAEADGFASIGDSTGRSPEEHYVHWDWINDGVILDPSRPESLVYHVQPDGRRILEAVMFILPKSYTLDTTPAVGGKLTQFHVHNNLCFTPSDPPRFRRITRLDGTCTPPLAKLLTTPMIHVWIRPNPCGPFAPIGGFASGTVKEGEQVACDSVHGGKVDF